MSRPWRTGLWLLAPLGVLLLAVPAQAIYLFFMRQDLDLLIRGQPEKIVGKQVCFTDELTIIWPQVQERPDTLGGQRYVLFDTTYFKCAIPQNRMETHLQSIWEDAQKGYGDIQRQLEEITEQLRARQLSETEAQNRRRDLYWQLYKVWSNKPIVTVFGTVQRADFWGPVRGKDQGAHTEQVTIVVDQVEQPRRRWYEEGLDDDPYNDRSPRDPVFDTTPQRVR
ncbi:MAG: hypothetical protein KIT58_00475 [Planctomycetota bacterium]|nr:hypothetical protein [Planctomycetota bacterium]